MQGRRNWPGRPGSCRTKVPINSVAFHNQFKSFSIVCNYAFRYLAKLNSRFNEYYNLLFLIKDCKVVAFPKEHRRLSLGASKINYRASSCHLCLWCLVLNM